MFEPKNLHQADAMLTNLTSNHSPLLELLQTIKQNTGFSPINTQSPKLQALNNLLDLTNNHEQNTLYQIFVTANQLHLFLQALLTSADIHQSAFNALTAHEEKSQNDPLNEIHHIADQNPEPIKTWFNTLANQTWGYIAQTAENSKA